MTIRLIKRSTQFLALLALLGALKALALHGYARDSRFKPLLKLVLNRQDEYGRWCGAMLSGVWF